MSEGFDIQEAETIYGVGYHDGWSGKTQKEGDFQYKDEYVDGWENGLQDAKMELERNGS